MRWEAETLPECGKLELGTAVPEAVWEGSLAMGETEPVGVALRTSGILLEGEPLAEA